MGCRGTQRLPPFGAFLAQQLVLERVTPGRPLPGLLGDRLLLREHAVAPTAVADIAPPREDQRPSGEVRRQRGQRTQAGGEPRREPPRQRRRRDRRGTGEPEGEEPPHMGGPALDGPVPSTGGPLGPGGRDPGQRGRCLVERRRERRVRRTEFPAPSFARPVLLSRAAVLVLRPLAAVLWGRLGVHTFPFGSALRMLGVPASADGTTAPPGASGATVGQSGNMPSPRPSSASRCSAS